MRNLIAIVAGCVACYLLYRLLSGSDATGGGGDSSAGNLVKYTLQDLENLWISNGGAPSKAPLAAAVAMAESSGDPNAFNGSDPAGGSFGLWQINGVHGDQASFDPDTNAQAAIAISKNGNSWSPWGAYTNGSYQNYLDDGGGNE